MLLISIDGLIAGEGDEVFHNQSLLRRTAVSEEVTAIKKTG
jgi:hypothetical protein